MNAEISETIKATILGLGMQIPEIGLVNTYLLIKKSMLQVKGVCKVYIFLIRITNQVDQAMSVWLSVRSRKL